MKNTILTSDFNKGINYLKQLKDGNSNNLVINNNSLNAYQLIYYYKDTELVYNSNSITGVEEKGNILTSFNQVSNIINGVDDNFIKLENNKNELKLTEISDNNSIEYKIECVNNYRESFSDYEKNSYGYKFKIDGNELINGLEKIKKMVSKNDSLPIIQGINFKAKNEKLTITALDGFRAGQFVILSNRDNIFLDYEITIPLNAIECLIRIYKRVLNDYKKRFKRTRKDESLSIYLYKINDRKATFKIKDHANVNIIFNILQGDYIDLEPIFNNEYKTLVRFNRNELLKNLNKIKKLNKHPLKLVVFNISDHVNIKYEYEKNSINITDKNASINGEPLKIGFNIDYLIEPIEKVKDEIITIEFTSKIGVTSIKNRNIEFIVLPVRLSENS